MALSPVQSTPEPGVELGKSQVESRQAILCRGLRPDRRTSRRDRELHPLLLAGLARVALDRDLDVNPDRLLVQLLEPVQLRSRVLPEAGRNICLPTLEGDFHARAPFDPECESGTRPADLVFDPTSAC